MSENVVVAASYLASGVLVILTCLPLLKDKIAPNSWYGVRVKKSFDSRDNWYAINRYGARQLMIWAGVLMACGVAMIFLRPAASGTTASLVTLLPIVLGLWPTVQILRFAQKL